MKLFVVAGVIDNGYTGEIKVALYNSTNNAFPIKYGDKIAQMVLIPTVNFTVEEATEITSADGRGDNGFGSTGAI
jgi:dUTP pyrophosphatase